MDEPTAPQNALQLAGVLIEFAKSQTDDSRMIQDSLLIAAQAMIADRSSSRTVNS